MTVRALWQSERHWLGSVVLQMVQLPLGQLFEAANAANDKPEIELRGKQWTMEIAILIWWQVLALWDG